jgi:Zn-dependent protease
MVVFSMLELLLQGQIYVFVMMLIAIIISLTFHEFGHAATAKLFGDNTAQMAGRLTLNPTAHIDAMGLLLVALVGFGYAKPVPTNPRNFRSTWASMFVSAAGPGMNLLIAIVSVNIYVIGVNAGWSVMQNPGAELFFVYLALINLILMLFNLLPIGSLDGHYILPYFLSRRAAQTYINWNAAYGNQLLLGLMLLSLFGIPVFSTIWNTGEALLPFITFVGVE